MEARDQPHEEARREEAKAGRDLAGNKGAFEARPREANGGVDQEPRGRGKPFRLFRHGCQGEAAGFREGFGIGERDCAVVPAARAHEPRDQDEHRALDGNGCQERGCR